MDSIEQEQEKQLLRRHSHKYKTPLERINLSIGVLHDLIRHYSKSTDIVYIHARTIWIKDVNRLTSIPIDQLTHEIVDGLQDGLTPNQIIEERKFLANITP